MMPYPEQLKLIRAAKRGSVAARNELIQVNMGYICMMTARGLPYGMDHNEYLSYGIEAYIAALKAFKLNRGTVLNTYAGISIQRRVRTAYQRDVRKSVRHPVKFSIDATFPGSDDCEQYGSDRDDPGESIDKRAQIDRMIRLLEEMSLVEQTVIAGRMKGLTLESLGRAVGVSKERIRQIEQSVLRRLRDRMCVEAATA